MRVVRRAVPVVGAGVLSFLACLAILLPVLVPAAQPSQEPSPMSVPSPAWDFDTARLAADHGCSRDGLGDGVIPVGALVARDGVAEHVSFDEGWAVYESGTGGVLLAVCES